MEEGSVISVCVTGAGGYVASWLVKLLLSKGYIVHGTVRDTGDEKNAHLKKLDKAAENLKLFNADLLNYNSLCEAISGCTGVFHVACPVPSGSVPNPEVELLEPAVSGTLNVLKACLEGGVKRVVYVSSVAAVMYNPNWPKDQVMDESCWSDKDYCKETKNWYCLSKTAAEIEALEYAKINGLDVRTVCPFLVIGPMLQPNPNASSMVLIKLLKDGIETMENKLRIVVDVRDVADALLLTYEKDEASGRYICMSHVIRAQDLAEKLKIHFPNYKYPKSFTEVGPEPIMSSEKLQKLGWNYRPLDETLVDAVKRYQELGLLN
ncbi:cinnamoyl-CoA reductase [Ranunculus cassubicifolius]